MVYLYFAVRTSLVGPDKAFYFGFLLLKKKGRISMNYLLKGAKTLIGNIENPVVSDKKSVDVKILKLDGCVVFPSFADVHVHFREPGFEYKETIDSGISASIAGGYTAVCTMPNLNPCPDSIDNLNKQLKCIGEKPLIDVYPYGAITVNREGKELSDMDGINSKTVAFTDDGSGVQNDDMMLSAMKKAKSLDKIICAHCEDNSLLFGGYIHDGEYAKAHGHKGISSESEYKQIARDLELVKKTGVKYHVCHISTKESVDLIRKAKADGLDVTCETAPHYLVFTDMDLIEDGRFKMNPPIRSLDDKNALIEGIKDGSIDMIATDHAPHSAEEKSRGLEKSAMGVVGLETAFSVLYTHLVKKGVITLEKLIELMSINPRKRFSLPIRDNDLCVFDLNEEYKIDPSEFQSMGTATPFEGMSVSGRCVATFSKGKLVWRYKK